MRIADPIYGTVHLSNLESKVLDTKVFQRLRNVAQLGLAHFVYPGANYSRFSHSLGACHMAAQVLDVLRRKHPDEISDDDYRDVRLAALLHDVGHYPFSHTMEHVLEPFLKERGFLELDASEEAELGGYVVHEQVGKLLIELDPELKEVLENGGLDVSKFQQVFRKENPENLLWRMISSDLDVDRLDYLRRTAHHTGLPYGNTDTDYLVQEMYLDKEVGVCLSDKAMRTVDHMLLCRLFDYRQVSFHKTVKAFELVLEDLLRAVLVAGAKADNPEGVRLGRIRVEEMIRERDWHAFDDSHLISIIRNHIAASDCPVLKRKFDALSTRSAPKMLAEAEWWLDALDGPEKEKSKEFEAAAGQWVTEQESEGLDWWIWGKKIKVTDGHPRDSRDDHLQGESVFIGKPGSKAMPLTHLARSLTRQVAHRRLRLVRIYVLGVTEEERIALREKLLAEVPSDHWTI